MPRVRWHMFGGGGATKTDLTFSTSAEKRDFGHGMLACLGAALRRCYLTGRLTNWRTGHLGGRRKIEITVYMD